MTENELIEKLRIYPELKERLVQLVSIIENANGDTTLADEAERRVIEEMRSMGHDALQGWARRQSGKTMGRVLEQKNGMRKHTKKNSSGIPPTEKL
jgi:hypothetical protein